MGLWGLTYCTSPGPDGQTWDYEDTAIAFHELTLGVIHSILCIEVSQAKDQNLIRIAYLEKWIAKLTKS